MARLVCLTLAASLVTLSPGDAVAGPIVFGIKSTAASVPSVSPSNLFSFDILGGGVIDHGEITVSGASIDGDGLAFSTTHGLLGYRLTAGGSTLLDISTTVGSPTATTIGVELSGREIRGAVFDQLDRLWVIDAASSELLTIDPTSGGLLTSVALTSGMSPFLLSNASDLAVRLDGTFLLTNANSFYELDPVTGELTLLHTDMVADNEGGSVFHVGSTFVAGGPTDGLFTLDANDMEDIFRYDVDSSFARTELHDHILPLFNSGRGDLAAVTPATNPVPEPSTLVLLGTALATALGLRRRATRCNAR